MRSLLSLVVLALALLAPVERAGAASLALRRYDCSGPTLGAKLTNYVQTNSKNVVELGMSLVPLRLMPPPAVDLASLDVGVPVINDALRPILSAVLQVFPAVKPELGAQYLGVGLQVWRAFLQVGGSPVGAVNIPLGLVCRRLEAASPAGA